jgi:hypothetical protein
MEQQVIKTAHHALPAISVMLNRMGYDILGTVEMTVTDDGHEPYAQCMLHARKVGEHIAIWIGDIGWDANGLDAFTTFKIFKLTVRQNELPKELKYFSAPLMGIYWEWKTSGCYVDEPYGEGSIKPETVHWKPLTYIDEFGQFRQMK